MTAHSAVMAGELDVNSSWIASAEQTLIEAMIELGTEPPNFLESLILESQTTENDDNVTKDFVWLIENRWPILNSPKLNKAAAAICSDSLDSGLETGIVKIVDAPISEEYFAKKAEIAVTAIIMQDFMQPEKAAQILFSNFIDSMYLRYKAAGNATMLLNDEYLEFGVSLCAGSTIVAEDIMANVYVLTIIFARPAGPQPNWIQCGHVYFDKNANGHFDEGEGLINVMMTTGEDELLAITSHDGSYCFRRPIGSWVLYIESYPFKQDYRAYNIILENYRRDGILYVDYPLLLTQSLIDFINNKK